ncbi:RNA-dependent RNA polymerase, eukaryotic, partial [Tanacetum coccineum]
SLLFRKQIEISKCLLPQKYPHFLEKKADKSYHSPSVLGLIYDTVKGYQSDNASRKEVWKLPCFNVEIPAATMNLWKDRYKSYRSEMSDAMRSGDESKNNSANIVVKKYKKMLYEAEDFARSTRKIDDIYNEALAIYHVSYDTAMSYTIADVRKCGFAWRVAGEALCSFHVMKSPGRNDERVQDAYLACSVKSGIDEDYVPTNDLPRRSMRIRETWKMKKQASMKNKKVTKKDTTHEVSTYLLYYFIGNAVM